MGYALDNGSRMGEVCGKDGVGVCVFLLLPVGCGDVVQVVRCWNDLRIYDVCS